MKTIADAISAAHMTWQGCAPDQCRAPCPKLAPATRPHHGLCDRYALHLAGAAWDQIENKSAAEAMNESFPLERPTASTDMVSLTLALLSRPISDKAHAFNKIESPGNSSVIWIPKGLITSFELQGDKGTLWTPATITIPRWKATELGLK